jgi:hypothetical protein
VIYRCRQCGYEEARGCLPAASCGIYLFGLLGVSIGCCLGVLHKVNRLLRSLVPPDAPPPESSPPWWFWALCVLAVPLVLFLVVIGAWVLKFLLELLEYLVFARRRCLVCRQRRWSWGFTRGFGL